MQGEYRLLWQHTRSAVAVRMFELPPFKAILTRIQGWDESSEAALPTDLQQVANNKKRTREVLARIQSEIQFSMSSEHAQRSKQGEEGLVVFSVVSRSCSQPTETALERALAYLVYSGELHRKADCLCSLAAGFVAIPLEPTRRSSSGSRSHRLSVTLLILHHPLASLVCALMCTPDEQPVHAAHVAEGVLRLLVARHPAPPESQIDVCICTS